VSTTGRKRNGGRGDAGYPGRKYRNGGYVDWQEVGRSCSEVAPCATNGAVEWSASTPCGPLAQCVVTFNEVSHAKWMRHWQPLAAAGGKLQGRSHQLPHVSKPCPAPPVPPHHFAMAMPLPPRPYSVYEIALSRRLAAAPSVTC